MKLHFIPKTRLGKWSIGLSIAFIILIWTKIQYSIPMPSFAIAALGLTGLFTDIVAVFRNKDRSVLNLLLILVSSLILLWIVAELIFPHKREGTDNLWNTKKQSLS